MKRKWRKRSVGIRRLFPKWHKNLSAQMNHFISRVSQISKNTLGTEQTEQVGMQGLTFVEEDEGEEVKL